MLARPLAGDASQLPRAAATRTPPPRCRATHPAAAPYKSSFSRAAAPQQSSKNGFSLSLSPSSSSSSSSSPSPCLADDPPSFSMASSSLLPPSRSAIEQAMVMARSAPGRQETDAMEPLVKVRSWNTSSGGSTRSRAEEHRGAATGALLLLINAITASELRINFTLYQLQDQSGVPEAEAEVSGVGGGDRRVSVSPTSSSGGSRGVAHHHHHNQPAGRSGPARRLKRTSATAVSGRIVGEVDQHGCGGRWRSSSWAAEVLFVGGFVGGSGASPGDGRLRRLAAATRGGRKEGDGGFISRALKVEGLKCKKKMYYARDMNFRTEGVLN